MKHLSMIAEELRKIVSSGAKLTRLDSSSNPILLVEEASNRQIEVIGEKLVKTLEYTRLKPPSDLYALDSSSRVIETPYLFLAIGAGSVFSRFTGRGFDVPHASSILGLEEPLCRHILLVPEVELESDILNSIMDIPGVLTKNPLGTQYSSYYNKHIALVELRLFIENCLLEKFHDSSLVNDKPVLLIDGPLLYPKTIITESTYPSPRERIKTYIDSLDYLNKQRSKVVDNLIESGIYVAGIVKRLNRSYYLSTIDPFGLSTGKINDEAYIGTLITRMKPSISRSLLIGPLRVKQEAGGMGRLLWYIVASRRIYPAPGRMGNYAVFRVEIPESIESKNQELLGYVFYDSLNTGSLLPLSILIVDKRVKKISSSITTYLLYTTGIPIEATSQYITMF